MESAPFDRLGDLALAHQPRALTADRTASRVRVALRGRPSEAELRAGFGPGLEWARAPDDEGESGVVLAFDASALAAAGESGSSLVRAVAAAALARRAPPARPRILGVLNVTPDSFSDGGAWSDPERAIEHGLALVAEGADALDVGGESTRPGSLPVGLDEERRRVLPVIRGLARQTGAVLSVDTTKARLAEEALDAGATLVNDVSAGRFDPEMLPLVARRACRFALMHMQGTPRDMQRAPGYGDVVAEVTAFLRERASACWRAGIAPERLWVDPGLGFGKLLEHNLALLARLGELRSLGIPLLVGPSRKAFIEHVRAREQPGSGAPTAPRERIGGTAAAVAICVQAGAELLRVHDVRVMAEAALLARAVAEA